MHSSLTRPLRTQGGSRLNAAKGRGQLTIGVLGVVAGHVSFDVESVRCGRNGPVDHVRQSGANRNGLGGRDISNKLNSPILDGRHNNAIMSPMGV